VVGAPVALPGSLPLGESSEWEREPSLSPSADFPVRGSVDSRQGRVVLGFDLSTAADVVSLDKLLCLCAQGCLALDLSQKAEKRWGVLLLDPHCPHEVERREMGACRQGTMLIRGQDSLSLFQTGGKGAHSP
jgi:hypothetical protein